MGITQEISHAFSNNLGLTEWLVTFLIAIVTYSVVSLLVERRRLPPGPFPIPILGNLLSFTGNVNVLKVNEDFRKIYGDVFTLWFGNKPHVFVSNWDNVKGSLMGHREDFNGRPHSYVTEAVVGKAHDIVLSDTSPTQIALRKIGAAAVRKYVNTPNFVEVTYDNALDFVQLALKKKEPFDPADPLYDLMCNMMKVIALGDGEKKVNNTHIFSNTLKTFESEAGNGFPSDFLPFLRPFYLNREKAIHKSFNACTELIMEKINEHKKTFKRDDIRDFIDAVLESKEEVTEEEQKLLTDDCLKMVISNLFIASVGTTQQTLAWIILYLANDPKAQNRVFNEIKDNIGDRMATADDRERCPYTTAVLSEVLRVRTPIPYALPHKTTAETMIGGFKIPAGIAILFNVEGIHKDGIHWPDPDLFNPERFIDDQGKNVTARTTHYAPFSLGKRNCIGERMARLDIFIILVTLLQKCSIELENGPGTADFTPKNLVALKVPKPYQIICKPRN